MNVQIIRISDDEVQTLGVLQVFDDGKEVYSCKTLELSWKDNKREISCIPPGTYKVKKRWSPKFKAHFHIQDVRDRTWILIHHGNFHTDIKGCILPGKEHRDINSDGRRDVTKSKETMAELLKILPGEFELEIKGVES